MSFSDDSDELRALSDRNADMIATAERVRAQEQAARPTPHESMRTSISGRASVTYTNGVATATAGRQAEAKINAPLPEGIVRIAGTNFTTTAEAAMAAGLAVEAAQGAPGSFNSGAVQAPQHAPQQAPEMAPESQAAAPLEGVSEMEAAEIELASATVALGNAKVGAVAIQALHEDAIASGELPRDLPNGVTQEHVQRVLNGAITQANFILKDTNASVATLVAMLNENELREARLAAYRNDDTKLRSLGAEAVDRLARVTNDPAHFAELTRDLPKDVKIERKGGDVWIKVPEWTAPMRWDVAVRRGIIKF